MADPWLDRVVPAMRHACLSTLRGVYHCGANARRLKPPRRGARAFEWLGFDLMLDEFMQPWVLEVNVSPDMSHSTDITASLVPAATEQLLQIVLGELPRGTSFSHGDSPRWERLPERLRPADSAAGKSVICGGRTARARVNDAHGRGDSAASAAALLHAWTAQAQDRSHEQVK